jgi:transposase
LTQIPDFDQLLTFGEIKVNLPAYKSKSVDHLGLVSALCQELGIAEFIDNQFPNQSQHRHISYGQLLVAMILNGLGFVSRTLHMYPDYFADKPVERLLGTGIKSEHINDDALGRCLDKLYEHGVSNLYQDLAEKVILHLGLPCQSVHLDSTSFHVDGEYDVETDSKAIRLTRGYSRDHRPDLNQVILNLITENQAGIPVYMQACSGNTNDSEGFKKLVKSHVGSLKAAQRSRYLVADAALYVAETIHTLQEQGQLFITRVPQKLVEAKNLIKNQDQLLFEPICEGYTGAWVASSYGGVAQKWVFIRSTQATKRELRTLHKNILTCTEQSMKSFKKLCRQTFSCEQDARKALDLWLEQQDYIQAFDIEIIKDISYQGRGRPRANATSEIQYQITAKLATSLRKKEAKEHETGCFILATNDIGDKLTMNELLSHYKSQQAVERGFRFLKSPDFLTASLFLKKPERIEALLMIMTCSLMIYAALEHLVRTRLREKNLFFPDMKNKPTQNPTAKWIFSCFTGVHELTVGEDVKVILNLNDKHKIILDCLGEQYWGVYL